MGSDKHFADVMKRRELATEIFVRAGTEFDDSDDLARPAGWLRSCCWPRGCSNHGDVFVSALPCHRNATSTFRPSPSMRSMSGCLAATRTSAVCLPRAHSVLVGALRVHPHKHDANFPS